MSKLPESFYQRSATESAKDFLGKYLVRVTPRGVIAGMIAEVEAYPAFLDEVSHGNKRTRRTEVMYKEGGFAYVYLIYGIHHQFAVVVNKKGIPDVVFIRAVCPEDGVDLMKEYFGRDVPTSQLAKSPGNLCKSFNITSELYGADLTGNILYLEDRGVVFDDDKIKLSNRVGIDKKLMGSGDKLRFYLTL